MKPPEILQHLSGNSQSTGSHIVETNVFVEPGKRGTRRATTAPSVAALQSHLAGKCRIGFNDTDTNGQSNWIAIDVDNAATHKRSVTDFEGTCLHIRTRLQELDLRYLEVVSRSGRGKHFWVLFDNAIECERLRDIIAATVPPQLIGNGVDIYPKRQEGTPAAIYAPFFSIAGTPDADIEFDLMNDANHVRELATQYEGRYSGPKAGKPRRRVVRNPENTKSAVTAVTPSPDQFTDDDLPQPVDLINAELPVSDYKPKKDNRYRKKHATISENDGKERHGHDWSDLTKTFSTHTVVVPDLLEGQFGRGETRTVLRSAPVFNTEEFYQGQFRLARRIKGLVPFTNVSELNRYFAQQEAETGTDNMYRNSADWTLRSTRSTYDAFTRSEILNDTQAHIHILLREPPTGDPNIRWRAFTLPINNQQFVRYIRQGANVYTIGTDKWVGDDGKDQTGRYSVKVGIKPTDTRPPTT